MRRTYHSFPVLISITALMFGASGVAHAQSSPQTTPVLNPGDTVRVWAQTPRLEGAMGLFARIDARDLVISGAPPNSYTPRPEVVIPLDPMPRVEVLYRRPKSAKRIIAGVLIGAGVGALIGAPMGPILECGGGCDKEGDLQPMLGPGYGAAIGAGVGGLLGGVIGGMSRPRWVGVTIAIP